MILVYSEQYESLINWFPKIFNDLPYTIFRDFDEYCRSAAETKISFLYGLDGIDDLESVECHMLAEKIKKFCDVSDLLFIFESQLHNHYIDFFSNFDNSKIFWLLPGFLNVPANVNLIFYSYWFDGVQTLYKILPSQLDQLDPVIVKEKHFEALLGSKKYHRDYIYDSIISNDLRDKFIISYGKKRSVETFYADECFIWESDLVPVDPNAPLLSTSKHYLYHGIETCLCNVIPKKIYNNTAYSIIAETNYDNRYSFFTEKTAKPLIGQRLFVAFSGHKFLHNLKLLGFQTFDGIIDESYDLIENNEERFAAAFEQVKKLCSLDQKDILPAIQPIIKHNLRLFMEQDWYDKVFKSIKKEILKLYIKEPYQQF